MTPPRYSLPSPLSPFPTDVTNHLEPGWMTGWLVGWMTLQILWAMIIFEPNASSHFYPKKFTNRNVIPPSPSSCVSIGFPPPFLLQYHLSPNSFVKQWIEFLKREPRGGVTPFHYREGVPLPLEAPLLFFSIWWRTEWWRHLNDYLRNTTAERFATFLSLLTS